MALQGGVMNQSCNLSQLMPGQSAAVKYLKTSGAMRQRLLDLGLTEHTKVICLGKSPFGDPAAYLIRGAVIAIRNADAREIIIDQLEDAYEI